MRLAVCLFSLFFVTAVQTTPPVLSPKGSISGLVSARTGEPLKGIKVDASPADGRPHTRALRFVETDSTGQYTIDNLDFGIYKVFAQNENMGYPNTHFDFYGENKIPKL